MLQVQTEYVPSPLPLLPTFATPPLCAVSNVYIFSWGHFPLARTIKLILIDNFVALAARRVSSRLVARKVRARDSLQINVCVLCVCVLNKLSLNCTMHRLHTITHTHTQTQYSSKQNNNEHTQRQQLLM